jgi:hypothetical protein
VIGTLSLVLIDLSSYRAWGFWNKQNILKNNDYEDDQILRKATVKSERSVGVCEIELIWTIENLGK